MDRRRKVIFALGISAPLGVLAAACTFPDVGFNDGQTEGGTTDSPSTIDAGSDVVDGNTTPTTDGGTEGGGLFVDGALTDVASRDDDSSTGIVTDAAGCSVRCDCDDDGYLDKNKPDCGLPTDFDDAGSTLLGDCDDLDSFTHPGAGYSDALPRPGSPAKPGDWNCDDNAEHGILENFVCQGIGVGTCTKQDPNNLKFSLVVQCGREGDIENCSSQGLSCKTSFAKKLKQVCR